MTLLHAVPPACAAPRADCAAYAMQVVVRFAERQDNFALPEGHTYLNVDIPPEDPNAK